MNIGTVIYILFCYGLITFVVCCMIKASDFMFDFQSTLTLTFVVCVVLFTSVFLWAENEQRKCEELD